MAFLSLEAEQSLWQRIYGNYEVADDGCWLWLGKVRKYGYPYLSVVSNGKYYNLGVYRAMYALFFGLPKEGLQLDHLCRKPACLNPSHLEPVTARVNQERSPISITTVNSSKTHCINGHPLSGTNLYTPPNRPNRRDCLTCKRKRYYESKRIAEASA